MEDTLCATTVKDDKYRIQKLEQFYVECMQVEKMGFVKDFTSLLPFIKHTEVGNLDKFFAKYIQVLTNESDPDGLYKRGTLNNYSAFLKRITHKTCERTEVSFQNLKTFQRELKIKRDKVDNAGKGVLESIPGITSTDLAIIFDFFLPKNYEINPKILAFKIEYDLRYYAALKAMLFHSI